ncbi:MAG: response regulator transcription factor [Chitinophagaceae bacterium]|nr:response regulator transcription factor [Chitinophagaceae bacterium]
MKCIAIDDEPLALQLMQDYISKLPYLQLITTCSDAFEASQVLQEQEIDLVFIDIQMPGLTGLQFIKILSNKPMFILVTAYEKFALESYDLHVVDYLLKPVELSRFMQACNKANELYQLKHKQPDTGSEYFFLNVDYSMVKVIFADIMWVEGLRDYLKIHLIPPAKPLITRMSMKALEEELPPSKFLRIHKSFIVSIDHITSVKKSSVFTGDRELPVGETYKEVVEMITRKKK